MAVRANCLRDPAGAALAARGSCLEPPADPPARSPSAAVVLLAAGAGVAALIWAAPDGPHSPTVSQAATQTSRPLATAKAAAKAPAGPTLHGAAPVFKPAATGGASEVDSAKPIETAPAESSSSSSSASSASSTGASTSSAKASTAAGPPAGPAAISVARDFAGAFVLYETGSSDSGVRRAFGDTATPELSRSLMRRPPRLPANVDGPEGQGRQRRRGPLARPRLPGQRLAAAGRRDQRAATRNGTAEGQGVARHQRARLR